MTILCDQICDTLPSDMTVPVPLQKLFDWIEDNGFYNDPYEGRVGNLFSEDEMVASWTEDERLGGTNIAFFAGGNENLHRWLGHNRPEVLNRLYVFALTGMDGSQAAFWLDNSGQQRIVHIGSGSGSGLLCVLADDPVDFLRLIAIGYDEVCWAELFSQPPNSNEPDTIIHPNIKYQEWVRATFDVTIPNNALEVVSNPASMHDENSSDEFWQWIDRNGA